MCSFFPKPVQGDDPSSLDIPSSRRTRYTGCCPSSTDRRNVDSHCAAAIHRQTVIFTRHSFDNPFPVYDRCAASVGKNASLDIPLTTCFQVERMTTSTARRSLHSTFLLAAVSRHRDQSRRSQRPDLHSTFLPAAVPRAQSVTSPSQLHSTFPGCATCFQIGSGGARSG